MAEQTSPHESFEDQYTLSFTLFLRVSLTCSLVTFSMLTILILLMRLAQFFKRRKVSQQLQKYDQALPVIGFFHPQW
jgi:membrane protein implicated in regulation of membrane protease activity